MVTLRIRPIFCALAVAAVSCVVTSSALAAPPPGWTAVDLGTLGGATSHAVAINTAGEIVGDSDTASGLIHAFRVLPGTTTMEDLGTLPGGSFSTAVAVNASGVIAGYGDTASGAQHAIRWSAAGVATDLGDLGGNDSLAVGINDAGTVVGNSMNAAGQEHAFTRSLTGPIVDVGALAGGYSNAVAINASGQVTGWSFIDAATGEAHAFLWTPGAAAPTDIGTLTFMSQPMGMNNAGSVVGWRQPMDNATGQTGFLRSPGITLIGAASSFTSANAINTSGQIVGAMPSAADATIQQAFSRSAAGVITPIATLGGSFGVAYAVNTAGVVVGSSTIAGDAANHAFLWSQAGGLLDLSTIGGSDSYAIQVNDSDMTIGWSLNVDGDTHATLWQHAATADTTPPVITSNVTGPLGADGWYTGNVTVNWTTVDLESAITSAPCASTTVTADTAGTTFTCTATSGGGTATQSVTIKRATPLSAGLSATTPTAVSTGIVPVTKARSIRVSTSLSPKLKSGRQRVLVTLHAPAGATASGTIQLKAKLSAGKKAKLKNVGSAAFKLGAGQTKTFTVMLNTGGKARLVRIGNLRVSVIIAARDAAGKVRPTNRAITVKGTKVKS